MTKAKQGLYIFLRVFVSLSLIILLFWLMRDKLGSIAFTIKNADPKYIIFAFLLYIFSVIVIGFRLQKVLSVQGIKLSAKEAIYLCFLGYFFNNFLPTSIGGDVVKAYYAGKKINNKSAGFSGVLMDRILAMLPFTFIPTCALLIMYKKIDNPVIVYVVVFMFVFTLLLLAVLFNRRIALFFKFLIKPLQSMAIYQRITKIYDSFNIYWHHKIILLWSFFLSLVSQALFVIAVFFMAKSIGVSDVALSLFFLLIPIVGTIGMLPSINGLGVREAGLVYMFKAHMVADKAFAISLLVLAALLCLSLVGGLIYAFKRDVFSLKEETE